MGKTKKLYLAKRILAMILAAAMSVTMIPQTALAAPADDPAEIAIDADGSSGAADADNNADDADVPADGGTGADDGAPANGGTGTNGGAPANGNDAANTDENADKNDNAADTGNGVDGDVADTDKSVPGDGDTEPKAEGDTPAAKPAYTISLDAEFASKAEYNGANPFADILTYVSLWDANGDEADAAEKGKITCAWKVKGADDSYAALTGTPKDAGSYRAVLTYPKVEGVHDGAERTVDCEITKAPVTITLEGLNDGKRSVKPGTKKSAVTNPVINSVAGGGNEIETAHLTLTMEIKDAVTNAAIGADDVLKQGGDYAMVLTPAYADNLDAAKKAAFEKNYELNPFTVDIEMEELIDTQILVTLADKHKQEGETQATQITKEYNGEAVAAPKEGAAEDYTVKVMYSATDGTPKELTKEIAGEDIKVTGKWDTDDGKAPTNAGTYTYSLMYAGKDGVYGSSESWITVVIKPMELTIEPVLADASATALTVPEEMTMPEVLSKVTYKVMHKKADGTFEDVKETVKAKHIWGTSYSDSGKSQIYEPLFTLQESEDNGASWQTIDANARNHALTKDYKYRIAFRGRKAVFNADGSYNGGNYYKDVIEDINSNYKNGTINGVDPNYHTNNPEAGKELAVTVTPGTKAEIDVTPLIKDGEGANTIAELKPKQYDGVAIYPSRSAYKNQVKLKGADGAVIRTEQREFTYTWYRYGGSYDSETNKRYRDRIQAQIDEKAGNISWSSIGNMVSPRSAGVYKLVISYEDLIDPATYNYADPVTLYFAIDPRQVTITPKAESYEILEGRIIWDIFREKAIEYDVKAVDGNALPRESAVGSGRVVEKVKATAETPEKENIYYPGEEEAYFQKKEIAEYVLQGNEILVRDYDGSYYTDSDYTCYASELVMDGTTAKRKDTFLNTATKPITVVPMGDRQITITVDAAKWEAKEKVYDAKPFAVTDLVKDGLLSVKTADGAEAAELKQKLTYVVPYEDEDGYQTDRELKYIVDAGSYDLYVRFDGDKDYAPYGWNDQAAYPANLGVKLGTFKITKKEIALTADLEESYPAGTYVNEILYDVQRRYQVTGYVQGQEEAFAYKDENGYLKAWTDEYNYNGYGPYFFVAEKGSNTPLMSYEQLQRNKTYEVKYGMDSDGNFCSLLETAVNENGDTCWDIVNDVAIHPARDYTVKNAAVAEFKAKQGNSEITSVYYYGSNFDFSRHVPIQEIEIEVENDKADPMKREVKMTEAIGWSRVMLEGETKEGNLVAFRITAPAEYGYMPSTAMYENAIKAAGGYVVPNDYSDPSDSFKAVFDATGKTENTVFKIRWEDGYVETYTLNFKDAVKLPNLEDAVAPKALAFNAADKKMAVGQVQDLDVKITKEQMGDVIYLGYQSETPETLAVNQKGQVTALKMGQGTITVFAQHLVNEKAEPILDAKGKYAKSAQLKINITKLDAPKKVKATAHGDYITLNYDSPAYGYRREIYVMEKNNSYKTPAQFDQLLAGMKENQWQEKGFAIAPIYITKSSEDFNRNNDKYVSSLSKLKIKKDYTIYVRNVCAVRTLSGYEGKPAVTQAAMNESAAGVVVNVKTKKAEVSSLSLSFYDQNAWVYDGNGNHVVQYSKLKNGTIECRTEGAFPELYDNDDSKYGDNKWIKLPLGKEYKNDYEEPKLEYALSGCYDKKTGTWGWGTKNDYAGIDKKGKIKITGFPETGTDGWDNGICYISVRVRDTVTGEEDYSSVPLMFEEADSVKAAKGSVTLSVGQGQNLTELLSYSLGKTKLTAYPNRSIDLVKVREAIREQGQADYFTVYEGGYLRAMQGGGTLKLDLTDTNVERKSGTEKATAKVTIKSKDLELVKNLKARDVTHNKFGLTFSYTGGADQFLLEVSDAKKPIYSKVIERYGDIQKLLVTDKDGKYVQVRNAAGQLMYDEDGEPIWQIVKNTYEIPDWWIENSGIKLTKDSQYTVSLTPMYGEKKAAKATSVKVKTTKIPAQDWSLENGYDSYYDEWVWGCDKRGGMSINVSENGRGLRLYGNEDEGYHTTLRVASGNTYTLTADVQYNRGRVNDTLIWSVGDGKVATVKAAAGTYCITLKGMKPGTTKLEVRSKLLGNKVIARYDIEVNPVGNAYHNLEFYGENEPE